MTTQDHGRTQSAQTSGRYMWLDRRRDKGPFDIIGDVHGCGDELEALLAQLGYEVAFSGTGVERICTAAAPRGRSALFVGDLVDRGPRVTDCLRIVMALGAGGHAWAMRGNHDDKFLRWLQGRDVTMTHGLDESVKQMAAESEAFRREVYDFMWGMACYGLFDGGRLAVAHAGIKADMLGHMSREIRSFCLYGDTTGEYDEYGLPVRRNWAKHYRGDAAVIYGHIPSSEANWLNNTMCIDTACVFGNKLTALRWPERDIVQVKAQRVHFDRMRPLEDLTAN